MTFVPQCPGGTFTPSMKSTKDYPDEVINFMRSHPLMYHAVYPTHRRPLVLRTNVSYRFTTVAVDQVDAADGRYEVLFLGTGTHAAHRGERSMLRRGPAGRGHHPGCPERSALCWDSGARGWDCPLRDPCPSSGLCNVLSLSRCHPTDPAVLPGACLSPAPIPGAGDPAWCFPSWDSIIQPGPPPVLVPVPGASSSSLILSCP